MKLTVIQTLIIILAIAVGTQISRWLPFLAFSGKKETPAFIKYLGAVCGSELRVEGKPASFSRRRHRCIHASRSARFLKVYKINKAAGAIRRPYLLQM